MFITVIHNFQKVGIIQMSLNWWMHKKMWSLHTMEDYSAITRNEVLVHPTTWMDLEDVMLHEISQTQKTTRCIISFMWIVQTMQIYRDRKLISGCLDLGRWRVITKMHGVYFWRNENVLKLIAVMDNSEYTKNTLTCSFKVDALG